MRIFNFDSFMSFEALLRENNVPGLTELDVILPDLSLSGYAISLEGAIIVFFLLLGVYAMLDYNVQLLPQEKFRLAISMSHWIHSPLVLLRNRLEEIMESSVSEETCRVLKSALGLSEHIIVCNRNMMQLDRVDWKAVAEARTAEVEIHSYVQMVVDRCRLYADSRHVQLEISHCEGCVGCKVNEVVMTAAIQYLLNKIVDITSPGGCIYIAVSHDASFWKLQAINCKKTKRTIFIPMLPILSYSSLRTVRKIIRLHGGRTTAYKYGKSAVCQIVVPVNCRCQDKAESGLDIFLRKWTSLRIGEVTDSNRKESTIATGNLPRILLVMADNMLGNYLQTALSSEFNISLKATLDISELAFVEEKPDAILIDENVDGICGDEICSRIKAEKMTAAIPIILLVEYGDSRSYLSHAGSGADRLELRTVGIYRLRADIHMLINSCILLHKQTTQILANTVHILPKTMEKNDDNLLFIGKVRKLLEENLSTERYTINRLSTDMGMSRTRFYNKMKELTGKPPVEYMLTFKMESAKVLLISGQYNITEIAEMLGYCDAKYFRKKFKIVYHTCPTEYLKNNAG